MLIISEVIYTDCFSIYTTHAQKSTELYINRLKRVQSVA